MEESDESLYSLRTKILISLIGMPFITLAFLMYLSLQTYQKDKLAYIFDSANSVSSSLAIQTSTKLKLIREQTGLLLEKLTPTHQWRQGTAENFLAQDSMDALLVFDLNNKANLESTNSSLSKNIVAYQERTKSVAGQVLNHPNLASWLSQFAKDPNKILYEKTLDFFILSLKQGNLLVLIFCPQDIFKDTLKKPGPFVLSLINKENSILTTSDGIKDISQIPFSFHYENIAKTLKSSSGEEYLISYAPIASFSLSLGAAIQKKAAFSVLTTIVKQSLLVFIMLVSICVIVGVFISDEITSSLYEIFVATQKIADGHFDIRIRIKKQDEVGRLARGINVMVMEIKRLLIETKEKTRMESELKTAQLVQSTFFPESKGEYPNCQLIGIFEPASECCGDWWYHFSHNQKIYFIIGDATGHGVPAALLTGAVRSSMSLLFKMKTINLNQVVSLLNQSVTEVFKSQILMTFLIAEFNPADLKLKYINASHDPAFVLRKSSKPLLRKDLECLNEKLSPRLGEKFDSIFHVNELQLIKGDRIFFYTDGILDLRNEEKKPLGERQFHQLLLEAQSRNEGLAGFVDLFFSKLKAYQKLPAVDDITFFTVEVG